MSPQKKYCVNCFIVIDWDTPYCPRCTYPQPFESSSIYLKVPHRLHNQFIIGRVLGHGSFGITYLAYDRGLDTKVAIKEYFPSEYASRNPQNMSVEPIAGNKEALFFSGKNKFIAEARLLSSLRSPHIIRIRHFFEENNTAYFVMEYLEGQTLQDYLAGHGGKVSFETFRPTLNAMMDALEEVHNHNTFHRDIKPENIYMTLQNSPILLDFGSARNQQATSAGTTVQLLTHGYAPIEQYSSRGIQGPWTDIYGLAATVYNALTGKVPPLPQDRLTEDDELHSVADMGGDIRPEDDEWLAKGLELRWNARPSSIAEWRRMMPEPPKPKSTSSQSFLSNADENFIRFAIMPKLASRFLTPEHEEEIIASARFLNISYDKVLMLIETALGTSGSVRREAKVTPPQDTHETPEAPETPKKKKTESPVKKGSVNLTFSEVFQPGQIIDPSAPLPDGIGNSLGMDFVLIKPFAEGSGFKIPKPFSVGPAENHYSVTLTRQYYMQTTPVTQGQWKLLMGSNPSHFKGDDDLPVECVSWHATQEFIRRLNTLNEGTYRLPSEAEWEFACHAEMIGPYFFGHEEELLQYFGWYQNNSRQETHEVGRLRPNPFGLYDLYGNVWEWCLDYYAPFPSSHVTNPRGPQEGSRRVLRGGSWKSTSEHCQSFTRWHQPPTAHLDHVGLRLVLVTGEIDDID